MKSITRRVLGAVFVLALSIGGFQAVSGQDNPSCCRDSAECCRAACCR